MVNNKNTFQGLEEYGIEFPQLVFATQQLNLNLVPDREWLSLTHKVGPDGKQYHLLATILAPKNDAILEGMQQLTDKWFRSRIQHPTLEQANEYTTDLSKLLGKRVISNYAYIDLAEGIYPVDCERHALGRLTFDKLPQDFNELVDWTGKSPFDKMCGCLGRWELFILGENSCS